MSDWKRKGAIQPQPSTRNLWRRLRAAKRRGDMATVGKLSGEIRVATAESKNGIKR